MPRLTKEEALARYGTVPLAFHSYYKYMFRFRGTASDGARILLDEGGTADAIYRYGCVPDAIRTLATTRDLFFAQVRDAQAHPLAGWGDPLYFDDDDTGPARAAEEES